MRLSALSCIGFLTLAPVAVTGQTGAAMTAVDWLSDSIALDAHTELPGDPVANSATSPQVVVTELDLPSPNGIGVLSPQMSGLPETLWAATSADRLIELVEALPMPTLPAVHGLLTSLMLAEAAPPFDATADGNFFLVRVDALLTLGRLDEALALLDAAGPNSPALFQRYFDIALLKGVEDQGCDILRDRPAVSPSAKARIFCLARSGDWSAAALTLNTNSVLGDLSDDEILLLNLFLDPALAEEVELPPLPDTLTPLDFRLREAIGTRPSTTRLPLAFAHADLGQTAGLKVKLDAAERLARVGSLAPATLQALYGAATPSASGGVWDRMSTFQDFETALAARNANAVEQELPDLWQAMRSIRSETLLADLYAEKLQGLSLQNEAALIRQRLQLLTRDFHSVMQADDENLAAIAQGNAASIEPTDRWQKAVQTAFAGHALSKDLADLAERGEVGAALLHTVSLLEQGVKGDMRALTSGLAMLRKLGLEDLARRTALQVLILERAR